MQQERDTAWSCDRMHKCGGRGRSRGRTALSEKELARGGTLPSFACMDGNLKFMWKGMRSQLKGSLGVWAVVWQDSIFVLNFSAKWWGRGGEQSCRYEEKLIKVSTVQKWDWGAGKGEKTWQMATAGIQQAPQRASVKAFLGVLGWFNLHDCSHTCKRYRERLGDSLGFSQSYCYLWLMRLNMFLISSSTLFHIITSVLISILLIRVKAGKENIGLTSSQCLLPHPAAAKLCHDLLMLVSLFCCPTQHYRWFSWQLALKWALEHSE